MSEELLSRAATAARLGVSVHTVKYHLARGTMPPPDGYVGRSPFWYATTIDAWMASRRAPGRPAGWSDEQRAARAEQTRAQHAARKARG